MGKYLGSISQVFQTEKEVGKLPEAYKPQIQHARFDAVDNAGQALVSAQIDTNVSLDLYTGDIPLVGPGAKVSATIGANGMTTRLQYANRVEAKVDGRVVNAQVNINGGLPPYTVEWSAKNTKLLNRTGTLVSYTTQPRGAAGSEVVTVKVTDANGIETVATSKVSIATKSIIRSPALLRYLGKAVSSLLDTLLPSVQAVGGITDYGTENAVTNEFGDLEQGFINRMLSGGVTERFSWSGTNAWEQDFKAGSDSNWIDNTDITFYVGDGYGGGFTFEDSSHDDVTLDHNDATDDWGDKDLEWLALLSCQVLKDQWSGMSHFDRWKQEFDGFHRLLGFHTNAYAWMSFSGEFADNLLKSSPMKVRTAWFEATETNQPDGVVPVVMGVYGHNGESNINDYFWGKGSVGPDIRDGAIAGYWSITMN